MSDEWTPQTQQLQRQRPQLIVVRLDPGLKIVEINRLAAERLGSRPGEICRTERGGRAGGSGGSGLAAYIARRAARSKLEMPELSSSRIPSTLPLLRITNRTLARVPGGATGLYQRDSMSANMRST